MSERSANVRIAEGFNAYMAVPQRHNGVAVVVLQEIFGVNANIRLITDKFAAAGYAAVAPDLYWRQEPAVELDPSTQQGRERAAELMKGLNREQALADAGSALEMLRLKVEGLRRSAAVGYCFGGGVAFVMAARGAVDAGVAYYGTYIHTMLAEMDGLKGNLLLHIAAEDHLCPPSAQGAIIDAVKATGDRAAVVMHPGVGHAFARTGGTSFNQEAADRADGLTFQLLEAMSTSI